MNRYGTSGQSFPLSAGNNNVPSLAAGSTVTFLCNTLPDRAPGGLAYYLTAICLTFKGTLTQPETGAGLVYWDQMYRALFESLNWFNCWHGTVVSPNFVKGKHYPVIEYLKGGFRYAARQRPPIPTASGATAFSLKVMVYPSVSRIGNMLHDTSQLAALFTNSSLQINAAASSVMSNVNGSSAALSGITVQASAIMTPRNELVLGTPIETVLHQIASGGAGASQINVTGFGRNSQLQGVQNKGGVVSLLELTADNNQDGVLISPADVSNYSFPWRNQRQTSDIDCHVWDQYQAQQPQTRVATLPTAGASAEGNGFPYTAQHDDSAGDTLHSMYAWPLVFPGEDCRLSDLQTADSDQEYNLTANFISPGNHQILAEYAKPWTQAATLDWLALVNANGSQSLAAHVLGVDGAKAATLHQRTPLNKRVTTLDNQAYLPFQLQ